MMVSSSMTNLSHAISRFDDGPAGSSDISGVSRFGLCLDICAVVAESNGFGDGSDFVLDRGHGVLSFAEFLGFLGALLLEWWLEVGGSFLWGRISGGAGALVFVHTSLNLLIQEVVAHGGLGEWDGVRLLAGHLEVGRACLEISSEGLLACGEEALGVVLPARSWGLVVHFGDLVDAAGGPGDGVFEHALDLWGSRPLEELGDGQNFLGDVVDSFVGLADMFDDEGGCDDG
jgi:hypothetical protein